MLGPRYLPNLSQQKLLDMYKEYVRHRLQIEKIQTEDRKKKLQEVYIEVTKKSNLNKAVTHRASYDSRAVSIERENQHLLKNLISITNNKRKHLVRGRSESVLPKNGMTPYRKQELTRIANANEHFARRLQTQQASLNIKKFEKDYEKQMNFAKMIKKAPLSPDRFGKLPPLKFELINRRATIESINSIGKKGDSEKGKLKLIERTSLENIALPKYESTHLTNEQIPEELNGRSHRELVKGKSGYRIIVEESKLKNEGNKVVTTEAITEQDKDKNENNEFLNKTTGIENNLSMDSGQSKKIESNNLKPPKENVSELEK